jgi:molecular chaperone DnaK
MDSLRWWRNFKGGKASAAESTPIGPRRRAHERYPHRAPVSARCSSWSKFVELTTGDVSAGGIFVPTDEKAKLGDTIELDLTVPDGSVLRLHGTVVAIIDAEQAKRFGKKPGLGVQLQPLDGPARDRFDAVLGEARASIPPTADEVPVDFDGSGVTPSPRQTTARGGEDDDEVLAPSSGHAAPSPPAPSPAPVAAIVEAPPAPAVAAASQQSSPDVFSRTAWEAPIVGIDLGTTYTSVAAVRNGKISILRNELGLTSTPSAIAFPRPGHMLVGHSARERAMTDPEHTVLSLKRLLGRQYWDRDVQRILAQADYKSREAPDGAVVIDMWGEPYAIPQLAGYLLAHVKRAAEEQLGQPIQRAVFTAPVTYAKPQIEALKLAAKFAQIEIAALIDEPSAAALANRHGPDFDGVIAIYDFGGGTLDVSLVDVAKGDFRVLVTGGDSWLGGDDFDAALSDAVANKLWKRYNVEVRNRAVELQQLLFAAERTKRLLSRDMSAPLVIEDYLRTRDGMMDLRINVSRDTFQKLSDPVIGRSLGVFNDALRRAELKPSGLTTIFLSGGTTYIPSVRRSLVDQFGVPVRTGVPPEHAACLGACIHAAQMSTSGVTSLKHRMDA